jgi:hypothetical protein
MGRAEWDALNEASLMAPIFDLLRLAHIAQEQRIFARVKAYNGLASRWNADFKSAASPDAEWPAIFPTGPLMADFKSAFPRSGGLKPPPSDDFVHPDWQLG